MAVPPAIRARIIDIASDRPQSSDLIYVDTNVWYWFAYPRMNLTMTPDRQRVADRYLAYMNKLLDAQVSLCVCGLNFNELASSIEGAEGKIAGWPRRDKSFRYDPARRAKVVEQIDATWDIVKDAAHWLDVLVTESATAAAQNLWRDHPLDPTDALVLVALRDHGIRQVLTDDSDFASVPGITMFTADADVIARARGTDRLVSRT